MKNLLLLLASFFYLSAKAQIGQQPVSVASLDFAVPGVLTVAAWQNQHPKQQYEYPTFYYGFAPGDEVVFSFSTQNLKGLQNLAVIDILTNTVVYSKKAFQSAENIRFNISQKSIYAFQFSTNHIMDRNGHLVIQRIPSTTEARSFNCNVNWRTVPDTSFRTEQRMITIKRNYRAQNIQEKLEQYVNSQSNVGGKSRVTVGFALPSNTIYWYYKVSANSTDADRAKAKAAISLVADLTRLAGKLSPYGLLVDGAVTNVETLIQPTSTAKCDIYVIDQEEYNSFINNRSFKYYPVASRANVMGGIVQAQRLSPGKTYFLGINNPSLMTGEHITTEIVALVADETTEMQTVKIPTGINQKKVAFLSN